MRGDGRSRRILVVPDSVVNPADGTTDHLRAFADEGWGVVALGPPGLVPVARDAWMDAIVDQVVTFIDDGYLVVLAEGDDPESERFTRALREAGRDVSGHMDLPDPAD